MVMTPLFQSKIDENCEKLTAVNATNLSKIVSSEEITNRETLLKNIQDRDDKSLFTLMPNKEGLCFSCYRNLSEIDNCKLHNYIKTMPGT